MDIGGHFGGHWWTLGGHAVVIDGHGVDMRWTLVGMGRTCGGHWWTWGGHAVNISGHAEKLRETSPSFYCDVAVVALMRSFLQASHALAACTESAER